MIYADDEWTKLNVMARLLQQLTPAELTRLMVRREMSENMRCAACIRVEDATVWTHDAYDVPHYRGNIFDQYLKDNPEYGPSRWDFEAATMENDEVPF